MTLPYGGCGIRTLNDNYSSQSSSVFQFSSR